MSSSSLRTAALAAACLFAPSVARAQRPAADTVALLRAVLGAYGFDDGRGPQLTVGSLPPTFPSVLVRAPNEVVGAVTLRPGAGFAVTTAVLAIAGTPDSATAAVLRRLAADGWTRAAMPRELGGFVPTSRGFPTYLCRDSVALNVTAGQRDASASHVRVTRTSARNSPCLRGPEMRRPEVDELPIPPLMPPPGVRTVGGGNTQSSSSGGMSAGDEQVAQRTVSTVLATALSPDSVVAHYAAQLTAAGWISGTVVRGEGVSMRVLAYRDTQGRPLQGVLTAVALPGVTERDVTFHVLRRGRRP